MAKMNIGPSEGMLRDLVKKKKIKSIKMKTKIKMNDPEEADETSPDDEEAEKPTLFKKKKAPMMRKSIFSKGM